MKHFTKDPERRKAYITLHHARLYLAAAYAEVNVKGNWQDNTHLSFDTPAIKDAWLLICKEENELQYAWKEAPGKRMIRRHDMQYRNIVTTGGEVYRSLETLKCCNRVLDAGHAQREEVKAAPCFYCGATIDPTQSWTHRGARYAHDCCIEQPEPHKHIFVEQPGEPPYDVCLDCGEVRY